jgi:hypothetical protein
MGRAENSGQIVQHRERAYVFIKEGEVVTSKRKVVVLNHIHSNKLYAFLGEVPTHRQIQYRYRSTYVQYGLYVVFLNQIRENNFFNKH